MKFIIANLVILFSMTTSGLGITIHVPSDQPTIQSGIDASVDGDTALVAAGTYTGDGNRDIDFLGKAIAVTSKEGPELTVIDCESAGRGLLLCSGETRGTGLAGFTVTNGNASNGGGIYCSNYSCPRITDCIITGNSMTDMGGGIACGPIGIQMAPGPTWGRTAVRLISGGCDGILRILLRNPA